MRNDHFSKQAAGYAVYRPSYPAALFEYLAALESVKVVQYPLVYDHGWSVDFEALEHR